MNQTIKILVPKDLQRQILKTFKKDSLKVYSLMESLRGNPRKGKSVGRVGDIIIRELKYGVFRFYYVLNGNKLILFTKGLLSELLIRFVAMSKKNNQQNQIKKIKLMLKMLE